MSSMVSAYDKNAHNKNNRLGKSVREPKLIKYIWVFAAEVCQEHFGALGICPDIIDDGVQGSKSTGSSHLASRQKALSQSKSYCRSLY
jgi:hypothetical protein